MATVPKLTHLAPLCALVYSAGLCAPATQTNSNPTAAHIRRISRPADAKPAAGPDFLLAQQTAQPPKSPALVGAPDFKSNCGKAKRLADTGNPAASAELGVCYFYARGGLPLDRTAACDLFRRAAAQHNPLGQWGLGACYATGSGGLKTNHVEAVRLYGLSAAQGNPTGEAALGNAYRIGEGGLPQDESRAVLLLQSSAAKGDGLGQADLGFAYRSHLGGLTEDQREAVRLYALSAAQGNALGQANLGSAYRQGLGGLPKSDVMAVALYKLSAAQGHAHGQNNLGVAYEDGIGGLSKNLRKALDLYQSAADQGYSKAGENLSDLRRKLDNMLRAAVESDSCAAITTAVQSGAPVNGLFVNQPTPLIVSILRRKVASAACLLLLKADPNQPHPSGRTPLMAAAATQQRTIMVDLMKHHADAHTVDGWGLTADSYNNANGTKMIMLLDDMAATLMRTRRPPTSNSPYRTMADQQLSLGMGVRRGPDGQLLQSLGKLAIAKFFDTTMTDDTFAPNHLPDLAQISDPDAALMLRRQFDTYAKAAWIELAKDYARQILALVDESTKPKLHARFIAVFAEAGYDYSTLNPL